MKENNKERVRERERKRKLQIAKVFSLEKNLRGEKIRVPTATTHFTPQHHRLLRTWILSCVVNIYWNFYHSS